MDAIVLSNVAFSWTFFSALMHTYWAFNNLVGASNTEVSPMTVVQFPSGNYVQKSEAQEQKEVQEKSAAEKLAQLPKKSLEILQGMLKATNQKSMRTYARMIGIYPQIGNGTAAVTDGYAVLTHSSALYSFIGTLNTMLHLDPQQMPGLAGVLPEGKGFPVWETNAQDIHFLCSHFKAVKAKSSYWAPKADCFLRVFRHTEPSISRQMNDNGVNFNPAVIQGMMAGLPKFSVIQKAEIFDQREGSHLLKLTYSGNFAIYALNIVK